MKYQRKTDRPYEKWKDRWLLAELQALGWGAKRMKLSRKVLDRPLSELTIRVLINEIQRAKVTVKVKGAAA